jgi:excinuclease UvrABC nuclease subunit
MSWSEWLDFDKAGVDKVPEQSGVFLMHASMKVHYIGGSTNMRRSLEELLNDQCAKNAKRFHYMSITSFEEEKEKLLKDYADKHQGKLPLCMEK